MIIIIDIYSNTNSSFQYLPLIKTPAGELQIIAFTFCGHHITMIVIKHTLGPSSVQYYILCRGFPMTIVSVSVSVDDDFGINFLSTELISNYVMEVIYKEVRLLQICQVMSHRTWYGWTIFYVGKQLGIRFVGFLNLLIQLFVLCSTKTVINTSSSNWVMYEL